MSFLLMNHQAGSELPPPSATMRKQHAEYKIGSDYKLLSEMSLSKNQGKVVLVAVDGSKTSHEAFQVAMKQTRPDDDIIVYHGEYLGTSLEGDGRFTTVDDPSAMRNTAFLKDFYLDQCHHYDKRCHFLNHKLIGGATAISRDICETAQRHGVDSVYVGSRGLSAPSRFFLGSVSWGCLHHCDRNVTIVKDRLSETSSNQSIVPWDNRSPPIPPPQLV